MDHAHKIYSTILSSSTEVVDFPLKRDFGYVMLVVIGYNVQLLMAGFTAGSLRGKMGVKYPDMGFGKYSMKLSEADREQFQNYQRVHYNYIEGISLITVVTLINGLFSPKPTAALGVAYMLGRMFYGIGYRSKGASGRMFGALVLDFAMIGLLGMSVYNTLGFLGYV